MRKFNFPQDRVRTDCKFLIDLPLLFYVDNPRLNRVFIYLFLKGCTFVVIFGLPGDKHDDDPARAVIAGHRIMEILHTHLEITYVHSFDRDMRWERSHANSRLSTLINSHSRLAGATLYVNHPIDVLFFWLATIENIQNTDLNVHFTFVLISCTFLCLFRNESIGITTGRAFCGVVGHLDRHEYTGKQLPSMRLTALLLLSCFPRRANKNHSLLAYSITVKLSEKNLKLNYFCL